MSKLNSKLHGILSSLLCLPYVVSAQSSLSVSAPEKDNSVDAELRSFKLDERLQLNLFADENLGIANPVCFRWDAQGRLWVLCTWAYPQLKPGERPNDRLQILEDTNADGNADKISIFADGLNMPTGFALGHGGVYIGNGRDLLHLRDTDGDGKADEREVIFTGFGTGDTHQNINSFTWTPGGELLFGQGLHCFSRVQTPWGIRHLDEHGSWRLRPLRRQLHSYRRTSGGGNPWGYAFGDWGEPFIKSNGTGLSELLPGMIETEHITAYWGGTMRIGGSRIKSMVIEIVDTPHLPDDLQGDFLIAGYFARNIPRLRPEVDGAGHKLQTLSPILTSSHRAFRPVDLSVGPRGALYVADWFNPIIGHYQASLRHPDRDKTHGRIWRITAKNRPLTGMVNLQQMNSAQLCGQLAASTRWVRHQAKLRLMDLPAAEVTAAVRRWIETLRPDDPKLEHKLFEAIGVFESHEVVNRPLLERLLAARDYRARAYATRVVGRWHDRLSDPLALLKRSALDPHPRVRLEAIVAASDVRMVQSIAIVARAAEETSDRFIRFAFTQAVHSLAPLWKPALLDGSLQFTDPSHLTHVVSALGGSDLAGVVRHKLAHNSLAPSERLPLLTLLASLGNSSDAEIILKHAAGDSGVLDALSLAARERNLKAPSSAAKLIQPSLEADDVNTRAAAVRLSEAWSLSEVVSSIQHLAADQSQPNMVRLAATDALGAMQGNEVIYMLSALTAAQVPVAIRASAIRGLAGKDVTLAAKRVLLLLEKTPDEEAGSALAALLQRSEGAKALANHVSESEVARDAAVLIRRWLNAAGRNEPPLSAAIDKVVGLQGVTPEYSSTFVKKLAKDALSDGDARNGEKVFKMPLLSCTACHAVDGVQESAKTTVKGPDLTAVAAGLPVELLIESVLWPKRQIKEGYQATTILTRDGRILNGFLHSEDKSVLRIRDLTSGKLEAVRISSIERRNKDGTVMPEGLAANLSRKDLRDLIKFLSTLK